MSHVLERIERGWASLSHAPTRHFFGFMPLKRNWRQQLRRDIKRGITRQRLRGSACGHIRNWDGALYRNQEARVCRRCAMIVDKMADRRGGKPLRDDTR